jgi:hypothetical protein
MAIRKISAGAIIALAATGIFLTLVTAGVLVTLTVPSNGTITTANVGAYSDSQCTQNLTAIDWGTFHPSNSTTKIIYVKNTGDLPITLTMTSQSWTPASASSVLTLTWDQQNTVLTPNQSIPAILTLTADSDTGSLTDFSFNILITGTEQ